MNDNRTVSLGEALDELMKSDCKRPQYDPPYDSPIEDALAWELSKRMNRSLVLEKQVKVPTHFGCFRLDLGCTLPGGRKVGIECDGAEFHNRRSCRDEFRDALILETGAVAVIYRFLGRDIHYRPADCLYYLLAAEPKLFSEAGSFNIQGTASDEVKRIFEEKGWLPPQYRLPGRILDYVKAYGFIVERDTLENGSLLSVYTDFASKNRGINFDQLYERWCGRVEMDWHNPGEQFDASNME